MITNERQFKITKSQVAKFEAAIHELASHAPARGGARLRQLEADALRSQLQELRDELKQYERLRSGPAAPIVIKSLDQLPRALVQARIAAGLSQRELAERLGLKEQQIQRYEATAYASASLTRLNQVVAALGATIAGEMTCAK